MTTAVSIGLVLIWRLCKVWMKCHRAAYRWKWWKVKWLPWGLLAFDLIACAVFFLVARTTGKLVGTAFAPARETLIQLMIAGTAATSVRSLRMPARLKRNRGPDSVTTPALSPEVDRETVSQYIERAIQQYCYSASQLWIMGQVVPHVLGQLGSDEFLREIQQYLEGHDGPDATSDSRWIGKLIKSGETDSWKVASACSRMLARNGYGYLEQVLARPAPAVEAPLDLPGRHPGAAAARGVPRPHRDGAAERRQAG
ncbi:hypothetical protein [Actinoplanes sp. N902-109]|uniref:hypothetical protein n=1 Tax=Actinoplanes sp. (strain N902-109) TaxID=649831 RepID=UPI0003294DE5|nr:hypothetical protein [Actinoplanes sp. N902-109]AGL21277.1 hypothetical protein L083_7767 [Actinoplanes sp. N902-109]